MSIISHASQPWRTHVKASKMSPCPGGYQLLLSLEDSRGHGSKDSLSTRGYRD